MAKYAWAMAVIVATTAVGLATYGLAVVISAGLAALGHEEHFIQEATPWVIVGIFYGLTVVAVVLLARRQWPW